MNRRTIIIIIVMFILPAFLYAGTLFEDEKKTSDPYVGEKGGFNSLFVNPAGAAGQSGFELSASLGGRSTSDDLQLMTGLFVAADEMGAFTGDPPTIESIADAGQVLSELYQDGIIDDALLDSIFDTTTLDPSAVDWSDPAAVAAAANDLSIDPTDIPAIEAAVAAGTFYSFLPGSITVDVLATLKTGFLIKGFGLGIYDHAVGVALMDNTGTAGLETVYNELGVIAGGGFNLLDGKLALGISGNYGVLTRNQSAIGFDSLDQLATGAVNYGYTWGIDLGAVWRPSPSIGVGIVFNDVVGSTQADLPYTAAGGYQELFDTGAYLMDSVDYELTLDLDAGVTWQPDWRFVQPKLSFDMYNIIGYGQEVAENGYDFETAAYRALEHMRFGANFTFFEFLKIGTQYYDSYLSAGLGLDLLFLEIYAELKVSDEVFSKEWSDVPLGADLMARIHF